MKFLVSRMPHFALNAMRVLAERLRAANTVVYYRSITLHRSNDHGTHGFVSPTLKQSPIKAA
jgi:hypothetical protein